MNRPVLRSPPERLACPAALSIAAVVLWYGFSASAGDLAALLLAAFSRHMVPAVGEGVLRAAAGSVAVFLAILVVLPRTRVQGALMAAGALSGAVLAYVLAPLGIGREGPGPLANAVLAWLASAYVVARRSGTVGRVAARADVLLRRAPMERDGAAMSA